MDTAVNSWLAFTFMNRSVTMGLAYKSDRDGLAI
jgi:hypothetical protein